MAAILNSNLIPELLKSGSRVAVVSSSGPPDTDILNNGLTALLSHGLDVHQFGYGNSSGYLADSDAYRTMCLNYAIQDESFDAILFSRGGYGLMRILDRLITEPLENHPKLIMGMSDLTALQLYLFKNHGIPTFSGPMPAGQLGRGLDELSFKYLEIALKTNMDGANFWPGSFPVEIVRPGRTVGNLLGGCISMVCALMGTDYLPSFKDSILFIEDVNEPLYKYDRMMTQLRLAGIFNAISGLIIGHVVGSCGESFTKEVSTLASEMIAAPIPIISGYPHGHCLPNITLPHGRLLELDTKLASLRVVHGD